MTDGGAIFIEGANVTLDAEAASHILGAKPGPYVSLRVRDTGSGIPPEIIDRIFEPFFTTKEIGKGTGLGLSTVMSIIKSQGALLELRSKLGEGTAFTVLFIAISGLVQASQLPVEEGVAPPPPVILAKPFTSAKVLATVEQTLRSGPIMLAA